MPFYVDAHIHSKYSRATSKELNLENLSLWANKKGIVVVGTGDFTHPAWFAEIQEKLVPAEPGLFRLKPEIEQQLAKQISRYMPTRFMLSVEISTIYKKNDKTRKVHHVIYSSDLGSAEKFRMALDKIGNIKSDGRPILGLDSRHLLEIVLQSGDENYLIPAHIWTPWFSVLGSKSGFDSIGECYDDLASHIFAVETGLSSDPQMNWLVSSLDQYRLVSNSDAHSASKLGREATLFDCELSYFGIKNALMSGNGYIGTVEFYPEEGKYHLDGHRKCDVSLEPEETVKYNGICPVCGGKITVGVLHRVNELADRKASTIVPPDTAGDVTSLIPLAEILAEMHQKGVNTKTVQQDYESLITKVGSEFDILTTIDLDELARQHSSLFKEAISRLRQEKVIRTAGYDGEYGAIKLFEKQELQKQSSRNMCLFDLPNIATQEIQQSKAGAEFSDIVAMQCGSHDSKSSVLDPAVKPRDDEGAPRDDEGALRDDEGALRDDSVSSPDNMVAVKDDRSALLSDLDEQQQAAAIIVDGPVLIVAGPGSGKTRTLTYRIAYMVEEKKIEPNAILAITFTRRAAQEMRERLKRLLPNQYQQIAIHTFHSFCFSILKEHFEKVGIDEDFQIATELQQIELVKEAFDLTDAKAKKYIREISSQKRTQDFDSLAPYQKAMRANHFVDFDDLILLTIQLFQKYPDVLEAYRQQFSYISVDEYQDIDRLQYQLIQLLAPAGANLCVIGDPHQSIYKFRGGSAEYFNRFAEDYYDATTIQLHHNYRSTDVIVNASNQVITDHSAIAIKKDVGDKISIHVAKTDKAEAEFIVRTIEGLMGGHNFFSIDSGRAKENEYDFSFSDFAILYRTKAQAALLSEAFDRSGMPFVNYSSDYLCAHPVIHLIVEALLEHSRRLDLKDQLDQFDVATILSNNVHAMEAKNCLEQVRSFATLVQYDQEKFFHEISLAKETDAIDVHSEFISLMTLHASKGLEFKVVFMPGLEEGMMPLYFGQRESADLAEEQRLFYVGMTRAQERLYLTRAEKRFLQGQLKEQRPSLFLGQIEQRLVELSRTALKKNASGDQQLSLW